MQTYIHTYIHTYTHIHSTLFGQKVRLHLTTFEKGIKPSSSKKDKELGLELGVCCCVAAAVAALSFAVGCCFLLLVVGNGRGDCCAGSGFFLPVSPARLRC